MANDNFRGQYRDAAELGGLDWPAVDAASVTPNDGTDLSWVSRALYVGTGGNLVVVMDRGQQVTFVGVPAGAILPIRVSRVKATGTTASDILALQ